VMQILVTEPTEQVLSIFLLHYLQMIFVSNFLSHPLKLISILDLSKILGINLIN
jgi:hypothetical protein